MMVDATITCTVHAVELTRAARRTERDKGKGEIGMRYMATIQLSVCCFEMKRTTRENPELGKTKPGPRLD